jgi:hypothetical protein
VAVATVDIQVNSQGAVSALRQTATASKQLETAIGNQTKQIQTAANGMRYFTDATGRARAENGRFLSSTEKAAAGLNKQAAAANGLKGVMGELLGALALASTAKFVFAKTAEIETQTRSIEVLTGSLLKAKQIVSELQQYSNVTPFTSSEVIDTTKRLLAYGITSEKVVETTKRLGDVAGATGANLGELSLAYGQVMTKGRLMGEENMQFQERGIALQEELRKMYKMSGKEFSDAMSKGQISAEAVEVAVIRLTNKGGKYANGAIAQSDTLNGKFSTLTDSVENLARTVGTVFAPLFKWLLTEATNVISVITDAINMAAQGPQKAQVIAQIRAGKIPTASMNPVDYLTGNTTNNKLLEILGNGNLAAGDKIFKQLARQSSKGPGYLSDPNKLIKLLQQQPGIKAPTAPTIATTNPPPLLAATGGATGSRGKAAAETAAKRAAEEALRLKNSLGDLGTELSLKQQIYKFDNKIFEANLLNDKETAIRLEGEKRLAQINAEITKLEYDKLKPQELQAKTQSLLEDKVIAQRDTQQQLILNQVQVAKQAEAAIRPMIQENELLQAKINGTELEYQKRLLIEKLLRDNPTLQRRDVEATVAKNEALQRQLTQAEQLKQIYSDVGMTIKSGVVDAIQGAIDGTKSLGEVATGILKSIANKVLDVAINFALFGAMSGTGTGGGLLGGLFKPRAVGGPVSAGSSYMVGERGPELFTPKHGGSIVPNNALGGGTTNVVVNVDASGSNVQGDQAQAKQLGIVVSAAVQAELVKQQRPGGLLAGTRR